MMACQVKKKDENLSYLMNECSKELNIHLLMMKRPLETDHSCVGPGPPSK